jgi:DNA-binding response OmpR family regulator
MTTLTGPGTRTSMPPATILVVDDESSLREAIAYALRREGFVVETASEGNRAVAIARERSPDLIVLDVMLPGLDGLQVCRLIRQESPVPIVMLSARGEELDRILGLEIGADDYVGKPFHMRELIARVKAQLRRVQLEGTRTAPLPGDAGTIEIGDVALDFEGRRTRVRGSVVALKPREFELLAYLMRQPGKVVSRAQILRDVWGYDMPIDTRTIDVHVRWIRQKLLNAGAASPEIETVRGVGYRLAAQAVESSAGRP